MRNREVVMDENIEMMALKPKKCAKILLNVWFAISFSAKGMQACLHKPSFLFKDARYLTSVGQGRKWKILENQLCRHLNH